MSENHHDRRVVITGLGAVTPFCDGPQILWENLLAGNTCADYISKFDATHHAVKFGCEIKHFTMDNY